MDRNTRSKLGRIVGFAVLSMIIVAGVLGWTDILLTEYSWSDKGIILEIGGFLMFLPPVSSRLAKIITFLNVNYPHKAAKEIVQLVAIIAIIIGLIGQLSNFN